MAKKVDIFTNAYILTWSRRPMWIQDKMK